VVGNPRGGSNPPFGTIEYKRGEVTRPLLLFFEYKTNDSNDNELNECNRNNWHSIYSQRVF
jgi:hypothetical protein